MDILSNFITLKVIFLGKETHYIILRFYKDNVNVTIVTRFDFSIVQQVQAYLDAS